MGALNVILQSLYYTCQQEKRGIMITCENCKTKNLNDAEVCSECGEPIKAKDGFGNISVHSKEHEIINQLRSVNLNLKTLISNLKDTQNVSIFDIRMSFISMVIFMIKWVIAAIPAAIILFFLGGIFTLFFGTFFLSRF